MRNSVRSILVAMILAIVGGAAVQTATPAHAEVVRDRGLAKQRATQLERLRAYLVSGQFSADDAGRPLSVFRDAQGRHCPMAHLMVASGRKDLVDEVVRTNNKLKLADVTEGPVWDWMVASGLTREEIVRIQGAMDIDFARPIERAPVLVATVPTVQRLRGEVVRRGNQIVRELELNTEVSLAVAESRMPKVAKVAKR